MKTVYRKICDTIKCNTGTLYIIMLAFLIRVPNVALL